MLVEKIISRLNVCNLISLGNSHANFFSGLNNVITMDIGPGLAYKLIDDKSTNNSKSKILNLLDKTNPSTSAFILSFGEIDVRMFVIKISEIKNITIEESVGKVVKKYIEMIELILERGYRILIHGLHGSATNYDINFPYYGTIQQRNEATIIFNNILKNYSNEKKIPFTSMEDLVVDKNTYTTNIEYINDGCHLNIDPKLQEIVLSRFLSELESLEIG